MKDDYYNQPLIRMIWPLLLMMLVLPVVFSIVIDLILESQVFVERIYTNLVIAVLSICVLAYPLYHVMRKIRETESKSSETKRNVAELIDHAADMILITRLDGRIVQANQRAVELLGYSSEELTHMHTMDIDIDLSLIHI